MATAKRCEQMALHLYTSLYIDHLLRLELFLSVWLAGALLCRMYVVLNPDFDYPIITAPQLYTSFADVNVVVIWILMGSILLSSMRRMSAVVSEMGAFKELLWTMAKNLLTFSPMFLLYDFWLIDFVYTTWTCKFALLVRALQTFPAGTLLAHSIYQHSFISMCKRNMCLKRNRVNISCVAVVNAVINLVMLLHLLCIMVGICKQQPSEFFNALWLMLLELVFRVVGLATFVHMYCQQLQQPKPEIDYRGSETALTFAQPSFSLFLEDHSHSSPFLDVYESRCEQDTCGNYLSSDLVLGNTHIFREPPASLQETE